MNENEKYIEAYYRIEALRDFVSNYENEKYIEKKDVFAILGIKKGETNDK